MFEDCVNFGLNFDGILIVESVFFIVGGDVFILFDIFFEVNIFVGVVGEIDWCEGWVFGFGGGNIELV